jgi:hypothetical protein
MTLLRLLNPQGIAGLAAATILALLLIAAKIDARHFKRQSERFEQLYRGEAQAHAETVANYRLAAERARAADRANAERVAAEQGQINERTSHDFEARLAAARARAHRLRESAKAASDPGGRGSAPVPGLSAPAPGFAQAPGQDRLSDPDRLTATEQAIQLDELIRWVRAQAAVEPSRPNRE